MGGIKMALESAKKITLNRYTHSVRASQAVIQFGVGAIVDFPNQTLMTAAPEYWREQVVQIHDERLEKMLHVDYFGLPGSQDDSHYREGVSYARFPEWYFCPKCRRFQPIKNWVNEYRSKAKQKQLDSDPDMIKTLKCSKCKADLVVTRVVCVCEHGHIDDFPWIQWVHCKNTYGGAKPICNNPSLTFKTSASSTEGLEGLTVTCESCNARATLKGAFDKGVFEKLENKYGNQYGFRCTGRHPWKNIKEKCGQFPRALQRSSSSVYFPVTASSLVIPPYSSLLTAKIEGSAAFERQKNTIADLKKNTAMAAMVPTFIQAAIDGYANEIGLEIGVAASKVKPILERKWLVGTSEEECSTASIKYRSEEYEALSGNIVINSDDYGDFVRESTDISKYGIPFVSNISLIHKIREVKALIAFSRIKPVEQLIDGAAHVRAVSIKQPDTNWYPAYEVRGEGIFLQFDQNAIQKWINSNPEIQHRVNVLNENYAKTYFGAMRPRNITGKFLLLHTISHLLIKQLSFECGYNIASLQERIYCSEASEECEMAGILIYTASGDSEGTMGGLVRQGRADVFPKTFRKAIEGALSCSNDPVCSLSMGQGRDSLNLSACYSCTLIPETSCEEFNVFLDRSVVVGSLDNKNMGLYAKQLYAGESWFDCHNASVPTTLLEPNQSGKKPIIILDTGIDLSDMSLLEVLKSLKEWTGNEDEERLLNALISKVDCFEGKEAPHQDCMFRIADNSDTLKCDLMWLESKVALFTEDNDDCYQIALNSNWTCFSSTDQSITVDMILSSIKEK